MFEIRGNGILRRRGKSTVLVHASRNRGDLGRSAPGQSPRGRLELLYGARYSPHDNPAERIWALKN
jgi:transposase